MPNMRLRFVGDYIGNTTFLLKKKNMTLKASQLNKYTILNDILKTIFSKIKTDFK